MAVSATDSAAPPVSYRRLGLFWAGVGAALAAGAITVQVLGPLPAAPGAKTRPGAPRADAAAPAPPTKQAAAPLPPGKPLIPAPDPALSEAAPDFPDRVLPIASAGRAPSSVYAAPFDMTDKHPRVALIISGAGLDEDATLHLLNDLPGPIDVAFSAYTPDARQEPLAARARQTGHECLLSVPMEPAAYPVAEEGRRSLITTGDPDQNKENLEFALSRMAGCAGATGASDGLMGERYAQNATRFNEVLDEITHRGLLYLDPRTGAPALENANPASYRVVDMVVDQNPNPDDPVTAEVIDQRLATLEHLAAVRGHAIGLAGPPKPMLLERVAIWAHGLAARGITLAPLTAMPVPER